MLKAINAYKTLRKKKRTLKVLQSTNIVHGVGVEYVREILKNRTGKRAVQNIDGKKNEI